MGSGEEVLHHDAVSRHGVEIRGRFAIVSVDREMVPPGRVEADEHDRVFGTGRHRFADRALGVASEEAD